MSSRTSLLGNFASLFSGQVITWVFAAIVFLVVPRYLGAQGLGVVNIGMTYAALVVTIAGLGMGTAITKEVARSADTVADWLGLALLFQVIAALLLACCAVVVAILTDVSDRAVVAVALSCFCVPFVLMSLTASAVFQGLERMAWAASYDVATKGLTLLLVLTAVFLDAGIYAVLVAMNIGAAAVAIRQFFHIRKLVPIRLSDVSVARAKSVLGEGAPYLVIAFFWMLYSSTDIILLSVLTSETDAGIYAAPMRLFGTMLFVPATIAMVVFPRLVSSAREDRAAYRQLSAFSLLTAGTASGGLMLAAFSSADVLLVWLLGAGFERSGPVILLLSATLLPTALSTVAGRIAFSHDRQSFIAVVGCGAFIAKALLGVLLIPAFDASIGNAAVGAAIGFMAVEWGMVVVIGLCLPREIWTPEIRRRFVGFAIALAAGLVVLFVVKEFADGWVAGSASVTTYGAILLILGVHPVKETTRYLRSAGRHQVDEAATA